MMPIFSYNAFCFMPLAVRKLFLLAFKDFKINNIFFANNSLFQNFCRSFNFFPKIYYVISFADSNYVTFNKKSMLTFNYKLIRHGAFFSYVSCTNLYNRRYNFFSQVKFSVFFFAILNIAWADFFLYNLNPFKSLILLFSIKNSGMQKKSLKKILDL